MWILLSLLGTHVIQLATHIALLPLVALRDLVPIPRLLHLLILHWSVGHVSLGASISVVTSLTTLEASVARGGVRRIGPCWSAHQSSLLVLLVSGTGCLLAWMLELLHRALKLLSRALVLLLPKVPTLASKAEWGPLLWSEARTSDAPRLSRAGGLPLQIP